MHSTRLDTHEPHDLLNLVGEKSEKQANQLVVVSNKPTNHNSPEHSVQGSVACETARKGFELDRARHAARGSQTVIDNTEIILKINRRSFHSDTVSSAARVGIFYLKNESIKNPHVLCNPRLAFYL